MKANVTSLPSNKITDPVSIEFGGKGQWFLMGFMVVFFIYHLLTLDISPMPWFDETFFASITSSYTAEGKFNLDIAPFAYEEEMLLYGPIYFWVTSSFTKALGFSIFSFRLPALIAGFLCILVFHRISLNYLRKNIAALVTGAFALDTLFNANMHSGRMETLALFFALLSIFIYIKATEKQQRGEAIKFILFMFSGIVFSLALLTTPRIGVLLVAFVVFQIYCLVIGFDLKQMYLLFVFWVSLISIYLVWVLAAFGSITNLFIYYSNFMEYVGGRISFPIQQLPLLATTIVSLLAGIIFNYKKFLSDIVILSMLSVSIYFVAVNDTGTYSVIIAPFQYALIGAAVSVFYETTKSHSNFHLKLLSYIPLLVILSFNILFFAIKSLTLYITSETRNPAVIMGFIKAHIPSESKVVGDEPFYYAVSSANAGFQYIHRFKTDLERERYHRTSYDYDYIVWSESLQKKKPDLLEVYKKNSELIELARFRHEQNKKLPFSGMVLTMLKKPLESSYNCTIYKRVK